MAQHAADFAPGAQAFPLAVRRLVIGDFRNYSHARLVIEPGPVLLTGENGAGKTNLLEAVSMLTPGRGLRRARMAEMDRMDGGPWTVAARVDSACGPVDIGTGRDPDGERRIVRVNGAPAPAVSVLGDYMGVVWLTPQMDGLFQDSGSSRRRFLDRLVYGFDTGHAARVSACERAIRERARLLRVGGRDDAWLSALEGRIAEYGVAIAASRRDLVARLNQVCQKSDGPFPGARLVLEGALDRWLEEKPAQEAEARCREALRAGRPEDSRSGGAAAGPQRSDLEVVHLGRDMPARLCSTGEQKALLIAIVLGHAALRTAELGAAPVLLLDEVAAHLDSLRRAALFERLLSLNGQFWLTGTDPDLFGSLASRAQSFSITAGSVIAA